ncbi:type II secretion system F family protein [Arthrobacter sp. CAN_A1]|uniref:type II secretion system F family protein n=1 Tax=Arthrobacter sp. CAN_A1 TaxID=2787717 RepID=UPI0018CA98EF
MTGFAVGVLLLVAFLLLDAPGRRSAGRGSRATGVPHWVAGLAAARPAPVDPLELPLFVHQLTALLNAGRSPHQLWQDIAVVYSVADHERPPGAGPGFGAQASPVLWAAQQAAAIGEGVPDVLRRAAAGQPSRRRWRVGRARIPPDSDASLWLDLAMCLDISERSGAPLAEVLGKYAAQLDQSLDAAAARATALAGPAATARLLGWLPLCGLGLGYLTGAQPLAVLFGSGPGLALFGVGVSLMLLGRLWSGQLVAAAAKGG